MIIDTCEKDGRNGDGGLPVYSMECIVWNRRGAEEVAYELYTSRQQCSTR
jgi:hypothetical protein